jgi:hypothetical protein
MRARRAGLAFTSKIREREIREIFQYWLERRPQGSVPDRDSIDPKTIPHKYLPSLFLYEYEPKGRFLCKLIGTEIARILGKDETGQYLDEMLDPRIARERLALFEQTVTTERPVYYRYHAITGRGERRLFSRILLPVSSGRGKVDQIFGMVQYGPIENQATGRNSPTMENSLSEVVAATDDDLAALTDKAAAK